MALHFILDGYNIIKQTPVLADKVLEDGRESLVRFIETEKPQGSSNNKVTVVFDGQADVFGGMSCSFVRVIFTCGTSADDKIKSLVDHAKNKKNIIVVTNDRSIRYYVRALGAKIAKVDEFLEKGRTFVKEGKQNKKKDMEGKSKKNLSGSAAARINSELNDVWLKKI